MNEQSRFVLKALISKFHKDKLSDLLRFLPKKESEYISSIQFNEIDDLSSTFKKCFDKVHYSWIIPRIEQCPQKLHYPIISLLPEPQRTKAGKLLDVPLKNNSGSDFLKKFIRYRYFSSLFDNNILPSEFLPPSPLNILLNFDKNELIELIDLLAMHDLVKEIRSIINKDLLKKVYSLLTHKEKKALNICLQNKENVYSKSKSRILNNIEKNTFRNVLHKKGLIRFGIALHDQHSGLIWHISHLLDTGRGNIVLKYSSVDEGQKFSKFFVDQINRIINMFFKKVSL